MRRSSPLLPIQAGCVSTVGPSEYMPPLYYMHHLLATLCRGTDQGARGPERPAAGPGGAPARGVLAAGSQRLYPIRPIRHRAVLVVRLLMAPWLQAVPPSPVACLAADRRRSARAAAAGGEEGGARAVGVLRCAAAAPRRRCACRSTAAPLPHCCCCCVVLHLVPRLAFPGWPWHSATALSLGCVPTMG